MLTRSNRRAMNVHTIASAIRRLPASAAVLCMLAILAIVPAWRIQTSVGPVSPVSPVEERAPLSLPSDLHKAGADPSWWQTVTADIARREYAATKTATGDLQAPNRAQNLRTTFGTGGIA